MPFEDMGIMRSIPEMIVVEPADPAALKQILVKCAELYGNVYIRSMRKQVPVFTMMTLPWRSEKQIC